MALRVGSSEGTQNTELNVINRNLPFVQSPSKSSYWNILDCFRGCAGMALQYVSSNKALTRWLSKASALQMLSLRPEIDPMPKLSHAFSIRGPKRLKKSI